MGFTSCCNIPAKVPNSTSSELSDMMCRDWQGQRLEYDKALTKHGCQCESERSGGGSGNAQTANSNAPSSGRGQDVSTHGDSSSQSQQLSSAKHSMTGVTRLVVFGVAAAVGL